MPVILLDDRHKADLALLVELAPEVVAKFAEIAVEFIRKGANKKAFVSAAQKLGVPVASVESAVEAMSYLFSEASRYMVSEPDFLESISQIGLPTELKEQLKELYLAARKEIRQILGDLTFTFPQFHNLEWRLDIQLASRALRNQVTPVYTLKLDLTNPEPHSIYLQTDHVNLKHLHHELEAALREIRSAHARRIMRNIK